MSGVPRKTAITKRVTPETTLFLLMRRSVMSMPSGRENRMVRKKMAQVLPRPSLIFAIIVSKVIKDPQCYAHAPGGRKSLRET